MITQDICEYLQTKRPDLFQRTVNLFEGLLSDSPDSQVVIAPTGGFVQNLRLSDNRYTFQVRVRDKSYANCYNKIVVVYNLLDDGDKREIIAPSGRKMIITALQPPMLMNVDEQQRVNFVFNVAVLTGRE